MAPRKQGAPSPSSTIAASIGCWWMWPRTPPPTRRTRSSPRSPVEGRRAGRIALCTTAYRRRAVRGSYCRITQGDNNEYGIEGRDGRGGARDRHLGGGAGDLLRERGLPGADFHDAQVGRRPTEPGLQRPRLLGDGRGYQPVGSLRGRQVPRPLRGPAPGTVSVARGDGPERPRVVAAHGERQCPRRR